MERLITMPSLFPVTSHTDFVGQGSTFVAVKGMKSDGIEYIKEAVRKGATTIVIDKQAVLDQEVVELCKHAQVSIHKVKNCRATLAELSAHAAGYPAKKLKMFGITGTKGKTTTSFLLAHIFKTAGYKTALLTSVHNAINDTLLPASLTTAQPDYLHQFFKLCVDNGVTHCVIEVAAQALSLHRVDTLEFDGIIFTNFAREHLEFYATLDDYFNAKKQIFNHAKPYATVLVNGDDQWCTQLSDTYSRFGITSKNKITGTIQHNTIPLVGNIIDGKQIVPVSTQLSGIYNFYNCLGACGMAFASGISGDLCAQALKTFNGVPGRFETYKLQNGARCIIDIAHNPLSFKAILTSVRPMTNHLIVVFGAGGERDAGRRPLMGALAAQYADLVLITTDNPRSEDPADICQQIIAGVEPQDKDKVVIECDRTVAIQRAYAEAKNGSIILLLGKGNEQYQHINNKKIPFSEQTIIKQWCL